MKNPLDFSQEIYEDLLKKISELNHEIYELNNIIAQLLCFAPAEVSFWTLKQMEYAWKESDERSDNRNKRYAEINKELKGFNERFKKINE